VKFYIATGLANFKNHNIIRDELIRLGHEITYDWTVHGSVKEKGIEILQEKGMLEAKGVEDADFVVVLLPGGRGTHSELGMSIALKKKTIIWAQVENKDFFKACKKTCIFYHLAKQFVGNFDLLPQMINGYILRAD
jgi:hypothetical protein